jgi:hypothetical protein
MGDRRGRGFPSGKVELMRSAFTGAAWIGLAVSTGGVPLLAQLQDNSEKQMTCDNGGHDTERARHCVIREQTLPAIGRLSVDAGRNGGATVKGQRSKGASHSGQISENLIEQAVEMLSNSEVRCPRC